MNKMTTGIKFLPVNFNPIWKILTILSIFLVAGFSNISAQVILASSTPTSITVTWTAPGDDDYSGTASAYDIRYSISPITEANWGAATLAFGEPSPQPAGATETFTLNGLTPNTTYYMAIKTADEVPNWSVISNILQATTQEEVISELDPPVTTSIIVDSVNGSATLRCFTVTSTNVPVYQFALDNNSFFPTPDNQNGSIFGSEVQSTFTGLDNLETYFWHCRAIDTVTNDTSGWSTTRTFNFNSIPDAPTNFSPANTDTITSEPFTLIVNNGSDNDNDLLTYHFYLSTNNTFSNIVDSVVNVTESSTQTTAVFNSYTPVNGQQYWWRCRVYDGHSFSSYSTALTFTYVDLSSGNECLTPPSPPTLLSPANGSGTFSLSPQLCIVNSIPAAGCTDPQVYTYEIFSDELFSDLVATYSDVDEGSESTCGDVTASLQSGRFYFWRVKCSNGSVESNWGGPFYFHTPNNIPPTPGLISPDNQDTVNSLTPTMSIAGVNDQDGTDVTYEFEISISSSFSSLSSAGQVKDTSSVVNWVVSDPLTNNSIYFWRVRATDGIGYSQYSVTRSFYVESSTQNTPQAPQVHSPAEGSTVDSRNPLLTVINGVDNEGDPLTYDFQVFDQSGVSQVAVGFGVTEGSSTTQWTVTTVLTDGMSYQWRARCFDGTYYSNWTPMTEFSVDLGVIVNDPPTIPNPVSPSNGEAIAGTPFFLIIENSTDPENDIITYDFFISDDIAFGTNIAWQFDVTEGAFETSAEFDLVLADGTRYYWRVRANDGSNVTGFSAISYFDYIDLSLNEDEYIPGIDGQVSGVTVHTTTPTLAASNIEVVGSKNYYFEVATDSFMYNIVTFSSPIPEDEGGKTSWQVEEELESGQDYFWRVKVNEYPYSPAAKIHIEFDSYAAPNPVHLGENVTFVLPPQAIDLMIQTVSGETVLIQEGISDEWIWNLRNSDGKQVAVGVYLWYIAGSDKHGKVVIKP